MQTFILNLKKLKKFGAIAVKQSLEDEGASFEDIKKCLDNTSESRRLKWLTSIREKYLEVTKPLEYYEELFNKKLTEALND